MKLLSGLWWMCLAATCWGAGVTISPWTSTGNATNARAGLFPLGGQELTNVNGWLSVKAFGAKGDGVTDDTTAIQAAADYMEPGFASCAPSQRVLYFPAGTYLLTTNIFFHGTGNCSVSGQEVWSGEGVVFKGAGKNASVVKVGAGFQGLAACDMEFAGTVKGLYFEDLSFQGPTVTATKAQAILFGPAGGSVNIGNFLAHRIGFTRCDFSGWAIGLALTNISVLSIEQCSFMSNYVESVHCAGTHSSAVRDCSLKGSFDLALFGGIGIGYHQPGGGGLGDNALIENCDMSGFTNGVYDEELNLTLSGCNLEYCGYFANINGYGLIQMRGGITFGSPGTECGLPTDVYMTTDASGASSFVGINKITTDRPFINIVDVNGKGYVLPNVSGTAPTGAVPYLTGLFNTNLPLVFDSQPADDPLANSYTYAHGLSGANSNMIFGFARTLEGGGILSSLVDALILKTNLGASASSVVSFMNRTCDVSGLSFSTFGGVFNGTSTRVVLTNLPDCTTNTLVLTVREPAVSQYTFWGNHQAAGLWGTYLDGERIMFNGYWTVYFETNNTDSGFNGSFLLNWPGPGGIGNGSGGYSLTDGFRHTVAFAASSNYLTAYLDGWLEYGNTYYGRYLTAHPLTNFYLGTQPASSGYTLYNTGEISSALVFNAILSPLQMRTVERALRWLEPGNENVIVIGDSTASWAAPLVNGTSETAGAGWPSLLANGGRWSGNVNFHVLSVPGADAAAVWAPGGVGYMKGWETNELISHGLGGPVTKLTVLVDFGLNDRGVDSDSLATSENALSNLCYTSKAAGAEVWTFTTPYAASGGAMWWTAAQEGVRQQENQWLRSNPGFYDHLVDRDLLFTVNEANTADGVIFATGLLAGLHLSYGGNQRLADAILGQWNGVPLYLPSYSREGYVNSLERGALFVATNTPVAWPPSPPMPGAIALVNSNGFAYVLLSTNGSGGVSSTWTFTNRWMW